MNLYRMDFLICRKASISSTVQEHYPTNKYIDKTSKMMYFKEEGMEIYDYKTINGKNVNVDDQAVYFLNVCRKQKGKAEKQELQKAINRAKREGLL